MDPPIITTATPNADITSEIITDSTTATTTVTEATTALITTVTSTFAPPTTRYPGDGSKESSKFPYPVVFIAIIWILIGLAYLYSRWRQKSKAIYIIPRVFVLCSPRTVQFHYELILRVGLPSSEYNPDKHDIDITVLGQQRNEVVPMTRLNTKTLNDEPLITSLSIIVYRLVEMPTLGSLILRHSGPFKGWLFVYDFTVIDLSSNKEQYYSINKYMGSLNRIYPLDESNNPTEVHYPIDDVPLPQWSMEDIYLIAFATVNCIMLAVALLMANCKGDLKSDLVAIGMATCNGATVVFFLDWLLYYYAKWNQDRREYFNLNDSICCGWESWIRIGVAVTSTAIGLGAVFFGLQLTDWRDSFIWLLGTTNACVLVMGVWNIIRQIDLGETIVDFGLKLRGIETTGVGMRYSEMVSDIQTKSGSASDDGHKSSLSEAAPSKYPSIGPRSSIKTFGFDANHKNAPVSHHSIRSKVASGLRHSSTGVTPDQKFQSHALHRRTQPPH